MSFRFEHIIYLWSLLALIPLMIIVFIFIQRWKYKRLKQFSNKTVIKRLMPNVSFKLPILKFIILLFAFIFLLLGLANLQYGTTTEKAKKEGVDLMIALDVSNSMMAEDLSPNRLERQ